MFNKGDLPSICSFIQEDNPKSAIKNIKKAVSDGTDIVGVQLEVLKPEFRTESNVEKIIKSATVPIYLTDYARFDKWQTESWEVKEKRLIFGAKCGADLIDLPGNAFSTDEFELTYNEKAVVKQKEFIAKIHSLGKKVIISTHVLKFLKAGDVLSILLEQQRRGADVAKIVTSSDNETELIENLCTTKMLKEKLNIPFVFVSGGKQSRTHRIVGPYLGSCMWFCAIKHGKYDTKAQPKLSEIKKFLREN